VLAADVLAAEDAEVAGDVFVLGFGFFAGACSAGTALAAASGVIVAFWADAVAGAARDAEGAGAELFLIADPMANAPPSPITSATASSSQRLRTSCPAGAAATAAALLPDINELSIRSASPVVISVSIVVTLSRANGRG
jgi:hypothetical protein